MKLLVAALLGLSAPAFSQECKKGQCPSSAQNAVEASIQDCKQKCPSADAATLASQECQKKCSGEAALAALTEECNACPLAGAKELVAAFEKATATLASLNDADKAEIAKMAGCETQCPVGKRACPTMGFVGKAITSVNEFHAAMKPMIGEIPENVRPLFTQRFQVVAAMNDVVNAQNAAWAQCAAACGIQQGECAGEIKDATPAAQQENCQEAAAGTCPSQAKGAALAATGARGDEKCAAQAKDAALAALAGDEKAEFCCQTFEQMAKAMVTEADGMLQCWSKCPEELAALCPETQKTLQAEFAKMQQLDPTFAPTLKAVAYYDAALQKVLAIDAEIAVKGKESGCEGCTTFQASHDLLTKAQALSSTLLTNMKAATQTLAAKSAAAGL